MSQPKPRCVCCQMPATISCSAGHPICRKCFLRNHLVWKRDFVRCCSDSCVEAETDACEADWYSECVKCRDDQAAALHRALGREAT
jgi:hypothetical protein